MKYQYKNTLFTSLIINELQEDMYGLDDVDPEFVIL
jgi:hypothetical protein